MKYEIFNKSIKLDTKINEILEYYPKEKNNNIKYGLAMYVGKYASKAEAKHYFNIYLSIDEKQSVEMLKYLVIHQKYDLALEILQENQDVISKSKIIKEFIEYTGDYFLFNVCNLDLSKKFFSLINVEDKKEYYYCFDQELRIIEIMITKNSKFNDAVIDLLNSKRKNDYEKILEDSDILFKEFNKIVIKNYKKDELRAIYICILKICNSVLFYNLFSLFNDKSAIINDDIRNNIIELLSINTSQEFSNYSKYISNNKDSKSIINEITDIVKIVNSIKVTKENMLVNKDDIELAYYTPLESFSYLLPYKHKDNMDGHFTLMNVSYMNDPSEGVVLYKYLDCKKDEGSRENARSPYVFLKSFTPAIDHLPMWDMYASGARGFCIVLDWKKMCKSSQKKIYLYRICYIDSSNENKIVINSKENEGISNISTIENELNSIKKILKKYHNKNIYNLMIKSLDSIVYLFKESHYYTEKEYRIIETEEYYNKDIIRTSLEEEKNIDINNCPLLFKYSDFNICIKEIIIGPKFEKTNSNMPFIQSQIEMMCRNNDVEIPRISYSKIDYR